MGKNDLKELTLDFAVEICELCDTIKNRPVYTKQIIRSSSSIGANVYEAKYAQSRADFINKMEISLKEAFETEYWLRLLYKINAINEAKYNMLLDRCGTIRRILIASIETAKRNSKEKA